MCRSTVFLPLEKHHTPFAPPFDGVVACVVLLRRARREGVERSGRIEKNDFFTHERKQKIKTQLFFSEKQKSPLY